jgi:Protein of unknown function (DUF4231)
VSNETTNRRQVRASAAPNTASADLMPPQVQPSAKDPTAAVVDGDDPTLERLRDQIGWYDRKSRENQPRFQLRKGIQLVAAAAIPVAATPDADPAVAAILGSAIVVVEGFQQFNQYQQNWSLYRSNSEALKHEQFLFMARAGPYADLKGGRALLADRIEGLIPQEYARWVSARQEPGDSTHA